MIELRMIHAGERDQSEQRDEAERRAGEVERQRGADDAERRADHHETEPGEVLQLEHHDGQHHQADTGNTAAMRGVGLGRFLDGAADFQPIADRQSQP